MLRKVQFQGCEVWSVLSIQVRGWSEWVGGQQARSRQHGAGVAHLTEGAESMGQAVHISQGLPFVFILSPAPCLPPCPLTTFF